MDIEQKIPVHIGLFGHIDSGKTAVASVLSEVVSTAGIDAHPQSKERGITIDLGFTSFILGDYLVTLVDGPGHADLIKISASSVEIIDCALIVIDINKGPQIQTGEHLIMIESLDIENIIVILNKTDLFQGDIEKAIVNTKNFFASTTYGKDIPVVPVSAKEKEGFEELKDHIMHLITDLSINRDIDGDFLFPIDHHFSIKGRGAIITGTVLSGKVEKNQMVHILPVNESGRVKNIQIFHQDIDNIKAGDRAGINLKNIDIKRIYRGCIATDNPKAFDFAEILDIRVNSNPLFKPDINYGQQVHVTIGMFTTTGTIFPYRLQEGKKIKTDIFQKEKGFNSVLWLHEKILISKKKTTILLSRLDLPPTTLRIIGSAQLQKSYEKPPTFYKYKKKVGKIKYPEHTQGIVVTGLAQSTIGAKKVVGKDLEPPFTKVIDTFGTKGAVIVGIHGDKTNLRQGNEIIMRELRSYELKLKKI